MANYSELLNDINAAIYENNDQEIDALEVRAILREMVTSLGSGFLFKGIATPSSPSGTGTYEPDQNVFYLATTAGTYTYLGGLVVAAGEVAFLCFDGTWTKKSSALLSTGSIVDNTTTEDATKPLSAKQGKVLADAGAATAAEVSALGHKVDGLALGKFYGFFPAAADLPAGDDAGYAYVGASAPFAIYVFNEGAWSDSGSVYSYPVGNGEDIDTNEDGELQFANRISGDGMGYKILRKDATFASQVTGGDTIYEIRYDFDLGGVTIDIPNNCFLRFNGGKLSNGRINIYDNSCIYDGDLEEVLIGIKGSRTLVRNCRIINNTIPKYSIAVSTPSNPGIISDIWIDGCYIEHYCNYLNVIAVFNAYDAATYISNIKITNCEIHHKSIAITLLSRDGATGDNAVISNNKIYFHGKSSAGNEQYGFAVSVEDYWQNVVIDKNYLEGELTCIELVGASNVSIRENRMVNVNDFSFYSEAFIVWSSKVCKARGVILIEDNVARFKNENATATEASLYRAGSSQDRVIIRGNYARCGIKVQNSLPIDMSTTALTASDIFNIIIENNHLEKVLSNTFMLFQQTAPSATISAGCKMVVTSKSNKYISRPGIITFTTNASETRASFFNDIFWNTQNLTFGSTQYYINVTGTYTTDIFTLKSCFLQSVDGLTLYRIDDRLRNAGALVGMSAENGYWDATNKKQIFFSGGRWVDAFGRLNVPSSGSTRPATLAVGDMGYMFYDTSVNPTRPIFWRGAGWVDANGLTPYSYKGTTANRPSPASADSGVTYYDTDLKKMILWNGTAWVNMDGTAL